ncbi:MAG: alpha/beta hydrolase [Oscillospiraceae bacterium]|nr:alpha/beta hydrolase [Oscillospiraceae bacterium]
MLIAVYILIAVLLLIVFIGWFTFYVACVRRKECDWLNQKEIEASIYNNYYELIISANRFLQEHNAQELQIESHDGLQLHAHWVPAKNPKGTIILAHGYRSTKLVDFSMVLEFYHNWGMNLLLPDQRCHGKSEGKYITFGVKESRDMEDWIVYHNNNLGKCPVILSGLSMGASTMLYLADRDLPENVKGIIADCGFTSPHAIISRVFRRVLHLPPVLCMWASDLCARVFAGFGLKDKDTRTTLPNSKVPVLMVHGVNDGFVPCEMTRQGYAVCAEPKELFLVDGADHGLSFLVDGTRYTQIVIAFLEKYVEGIQ